jgi:hypothetical protein
VFVTELWLRNVDRRWSGRRRSCCSSPAVSTSSAAYVGLLAYGALVLLRLTYFVGTIPARRGWRCWSACSGLVAAARPDRGERDRRRFGRRILQMTTKQAGSASGEVRVLGNAGRACLCHIVGQASA